MGEVVSLKTPAERAAFARSFVKAAPQRELRTLAEAMALLDEWVAAYWQLYRDAVAECDALQDKLLFARTDLTIEQSERLLERIEFQEELARLRKLAV